MDPEICQEQGHNIEISSLKRINMRDLFTRPSLKEI